MTICGRFLTHIDAWVGLLNVILYQKYKILLAREFPKNANTFIRDNLQNSEMTYHGKFVYDRNYNDDMLVDNCRLNSKVYEIAEQQARNINDSLSYCQPQINIGASLS